MTRLLSQIVLTVSCLVSFSEASGTRGAHPAKEAPSAPSAPVRHLSSNYHSEAQRRLAELTDYTDVHCQEELTVDIVCQEEPGGICGDFSQKRGSCESKLFQYHGGACRSGTALPPVTQSVRQGGSHHNPTTTAMLLPEARQPFFDTATDTASDCLDFNGGPPSVAGQAVFVVITDLDDPTKPASSMWTTSGEYFWTDYKDYPIGQGLSDRQNITFYASDINPRFDTMLQTMVFWAPCEGTHNFLNTLDRGQSVQLIGTAVDPQIEATFEIRIAGVAGTSDEWQLKRVAMATTALPPFEVLDLVGLGDRTVSATADDILLPYRVEFDRSEHLTILTTVSAVNAQGYECRISGLFDVPPSSTTAANGSWIQSQTQQPSVVVTTTITP